MDGLIHSKTTRNNALQCNRVTSNSTNSYNNFIQYKIQYMYWSPAKCRSHLVELAPISRSLVISYNTPHNKVIIIIHVHVVITFTDFKYEIYKVT